MSVFTPKGLYAFPEREVRVIRCVIFIFCLSLAWALVWLDGCNDNPTQPPEPESPAHEYTFVAINDREVMYTYHPETLELDSVKAPYRAPYGVTASPDGQRLYFPCWVNLNHMFVFWTWRPSSQSPI